MVDSTVPGMMAEHAIITPNCLVVQGGAMNAFDVAVARLRKAFVAGLQGYPGANFHVVITIDTNNNGNSKEATP